MIEPAAKFRWVTADHHFFHGSMLRWYPWRGEHAGSVSEMTRWLISEWNSVVQPEDHVLHLGDFALGTKDDIAGLVPALNGRITLVRGNHDRAGCGFLRSLGLEVHRKKLVLHLNSAYIVCRHRPVSFSAEEASDAAVLLHGHCHGKAAYSKCYPSVPTKSHDVGIDVFETARPQPLERFYASHL